MADLSDLHSELRQVQKQLDAAYQTFFAEYPDCDIDTAYELEHIAPMQRAVDKARMKLLRKPSKLPMDIARKVVSIYGDELHCTNDEIAALVNDARRFL